MRTDTCTRQMGPYGVCGGMWIAFPWYDRCQKCGAIQRHVIPALPEDHALRKALRDLPAPTAEEAREQTRNAAKARPSVKQRNEGHLPHPVIQKSRSVSFRTEGVREANLVEHGKTV